MQAFIRIMSQIKRFLPDGKRFTALALAFLLAFTAVPLEGIDLSGIHFGSPKASFADLALDNGGTIGDVTISIQHVGTDTRGAYVEIIGSKLKGLNVRFKLKNIGFEAIGTKTADEDSFVKYTFTADEAKKLEGDLLIGSKTISTGLNNSFPVLTSVEKRTLNTDLYPTTTTENLVLIGRNLDQIETVAGEAGKVKATYGKTQRSPILFDNVAPDQDTADKLTVEEPTPPDSDGLQSVVFTKDALQGAVGSQYNTHVVFSYSDAFRFIKELDLDNLTMTPNIGEKGDEVIFEADDFPEYSYGVFFLDPNNAADDFKTDNMGTETTLIKDVNGGTRDQLRIKVPDNANFQNRVYKVVITRLLNQTEVIATHTLLETFNVIEAGYKPTITDISPNIGDDIGETVIIKGQSLVSLDLPELSGTSLLTEDVVTGSPGNKTLVIDYKTGAYTFKGLDVNVKRQITGVIGKEVTFNPPKTEKNDFKDSLEVRTAVITDALTDPKKDVTLELTTIIRDAGTNAVVYTFKQRVSVKDGFTFRPSGVKPTITKANPEIIQVSDNGVGYYRIENDTVLRIEGKNFFVVQVQDGSGNLYSRYPSVFFKTGSQPINDDYQLGFLPNELYGGARGVIRYENNAVPIPARNILTVPDPGGGPAIPARVQMTVLNDKGEVVTGAAGNESGTVILLRIPNTTLINKKGILNLQVTNPLRNSDTLGDTAVFPGGVNLRETTNTMSITSVDPNILTIGGGQDITVKGNNFDSGIKVYIDGELITGVAASIDPVTSENVLKFKSIKHLEGPAQLLLQNEDGFTAVVDLTYVKDLSPGPVISSFAPPSGIKGTHVTITGKNFLRPTPAVGSLTGLDIYRAIGSRVFLDGKDVNEYHLGSAGEVIAKPYTIPTAQGLVRTVAPKTDYGTFKDDAYAYDNGTGQPYAFEKDKDGNVRFVGAGKDFTLKPTADPNTFDVFGPTGTAYGAAALTENVPAAPGDQYRQTFLITPTDVLIPPTQIISVVDTKVLHLGYTLEGKQVAVASSFAESLILKENGKDNYFSLYNSIGGKVILSNGKGTEYTITHNGANFMAKRGNNPADIVTQTPTGLSVGGGLKLSFMTVYVSDSDGKIVGDRTKVISESLIGFNVPQLPTGGYKNLAVVNPDTKKDEKTGNAGFLYIQTTSSKPMISQISPVSGSDEGGYNVRIDGKQFDTGMKVFFGASMVPTNETFVASDGNSVVVRVPKCYVNLNDLKLDRFSVPVTVLNPGGGTDSRVPGFTYVSPASTPFITRINPTTGSTAGGNLVEIQGREFRFYEPFTESATGTPGYDATDDFVDLNGNGTWDNYVLDKTTLTKIPDNTHPDFDYYYSSPVLPTVYFGENKAKIVEFSGDGYIKVVVPAHAAGVMDVFVVNNDYGTSNKLKYTYKSSAPKITTLVPNKGRMQGQERKEINGTDLYPSEIKGYYAAKDAVLPAIVDAATYVKVIPDVHAPIKFANMDNLTATQDDLDSYGQVNNGRATVLLGKAKNFRVDYDANTKQVKIEYTEGLKRYTRTFSGFDEKPTFFPMEMLIDSTGKFYGPTGLKTHTGLTYTNSVYEYVKVYVSGGLLKVERYYAPKVTYFDKTHVQVITPNYFTIGQVVMAYFNGDGGIATAPFTYINPASEPKIFRIKDNGISLDETFLKVEGAINGNIEIEILGLDFRKDSKVYIKDKLATNMEFTTAVVNGVTYDVIIAKVPTATEADIDLKYPIIVENPDGGLANSTTDDNLVGPNYTTPAGVPKTLPIYFIYRKPLSGPKIESITPSETSVAANDPAKGLYNWITIKGTDFREGATVIIGSRGGVPISGADNIKISERGTILKFRVPVGLTLGDKNVQVINPDFGIDTKTNGLKIVSYPTTEQSFTDAKGNTMQRLSVEGGQTIRIKGTEFYDGAKVVFGGTRSLKGTTTTSNPFGLWRDDQYYEITGGVLGTGVKVIDKNTIEVTTPVMKDEGDIYITVINSDGGISDGNTKTTVKVPVPSDPVGLKVKLVDEMYIELYDYVSENLDYYEIYYYIGSRETYNKEEENKQRLFKYLDVTDREPYKILELPGFETRNTETDYVWFMIKAVNKFGASNYSNVAYLTPFQVKKIKEISYPDKDGPIGVPEGKDYVASVKDGMLTVNLSPSKLTNLNVNLSSLNPQKFTLREINIPGNRVASDNHAITVDFIDSKIGFKPTVLNTGSFNSGGNSSTNATYGKIKNQSITDEYANAMKTAIPRGYVPSSKIFQMDFYSVSNTEKQTINTLNGTVSMELSYKDYKLTKAQENSLVACKYDPVTDKWVKVAFTINKTSDTVMVKVAGTGAYMLITKR